MGAESSTRSSPEKRRNSLAQLGQVAVSARYHRLPKRIEDDYSISESVLGTGYNGVVRMAENRGAVNPQKFAVKALKLTAIDAELKAQLESEVDVFLGMDHPHVARLFDVYESPDHLYLVMECMEGGELFDRVTERKRFSEADAAEAVRQMLLAINYLHSHGIVHRDLKLENFLYDWKCSEHLKLIDFGFSKVWDPSVKMRKGCGTLSYVAPEVLTKSYTNQCDMWSLGVITFILLAGYMPFSGPEARQTQNIKDGKYVFKPEKWGSVSADAKEFVKALLQVNPDKRLTAEKALQHAWIKDKEARPEIDVTIVESLRQFGQASRFRRCALSMMAWSLSNEERAKVREYFVSMDKNNQGTITLSELKQVMIDKFDIPDGECMQVFEALDSNNDETIHYSDFLAAMLSSRIELHGDLLRAAFKRLDADSSGYITVENLREVLGDTFQGEQVEALIADADILKDGRVSYAEFVSYLRGTPLESHAHAAEQIINKELRRGDTETHLGLMPNQYKGLRARPSEKNSDLGSGAHKTDSLVANDGTEQKAAFQCCIIA